jgi:hypothetical protein
MPSVARKLMRPLRRPIFWLERQLYFADVFSLRGLTLPRFLGLGSGQSGTTWLYRNLAEHPEIVVSEPKETHYFTRKLNDWSLSHYASLFADRNRLVGGEVTPGYNVLTLDRVRLIRKIVPDVRLVLMVRNPIERAWSAARRHCSQWAETSGTAFEDISDDVFYNYFRTEWMTHFNPPRKAYHFEPGLLQGHYTQQLDRWEAVFPKDQILVGFFDELQSDPQALLARIFHHIGVSSDVDWDSFPLRQVINKNPDHEIPERFRRDLEGLYGAEIERLRERLGGPAREWR